MIILSRNECPYPPSPKVREYVAKYLRTLNRYETEGLEKSVREALAEYADVSTEQVFPLLGSEAFFTYLPWAMIKYNMRFVFSSPTFTPAVDDLRIWGIEVVDVPLTSDFRIDIEGIMRFSGPNSILYVIRPNNPTGNEVITCRELSRLAREFGVVVVDEAYYEFSGLTCVDLLKEHDNIVILRTMSKAFCIAGVRFGYMICNPKLYKKLMGARRKYDIPVPTLAAALGALHDIDYMKSIVRKIIETRKWVVSRLKEISDVEVVDTLTNFILVGKKGYDSHKLTTKLAEKGILVKKLSGVLDKYVRVSIGTREEMEYFTKVLEGI